MEIDSRRGVSPDDVLAVIKDGLAGGAKSESINVVIRCAGARRLLPMCAS